MKSCICAETSILLLNPPELLNVLILKVTYLFKL